MLASNQGKTIKEEAATAALKAQLQKELMNKKQCAYQPYECTQLSVDRYNYCLQHILSDKTAPFKQCTFLYTNGKRCHLPSPKADKNGYCNEHSLKTHLQRSRNTSKQPPPKTAEVLLHTLSHYVRKPRPRTISGPDDGGRTTPDPPDAKATKSYDPFLDLNAAEINASCKDVLDLCSESESDVEASTFSTVWQDVHADSSDNESIDSENGDYLKHANIYTAEEITSIAKDKLHRLQDLYMEQFHHLHHILRERKRKYLQALKREKETCCSIAEQLRDNPKEQRMYKKLKAYNQYHKKFGVDAIMAKRENELRLKATEGVVHKPQTFTKCAFTEGGVKCTERAIPVARHCRKHILEDHSQVLFRMCGKTCADIECAAPVEALFDDSRCPLHREIPAVRSYAQVRKDSDSDNEEPIDPSSVPPTSEDILHLNPKVQAELITEHISLSDSFLKSMNESSEIKLDGTDEEMPLALDIPIELKDERIEELAKTENCDEKSIKLEEQLSEINNKVLEIEKQIAEYGKKALEKSEATEECIEPVKEGPMEGIHKSVMDLDKVPDNVDGIPEPIPNLALDLVQKMLESDNHKEDSSDKMDISANEANP